MLENQMADRSNSAKGRRSKDAILLEEALSDEPCFPYVPGLTEAEKPLWRDIVNTRGSDYWNRGDVPILKMYCRLVVDIERLTEEIREEGEVIFNTNGNPVVNPKITIRGFHEAKLFTLCSKLRMQPASRKSVADEAAGNAKVKKAKRAAEVIESDDDGLLAGSTLQ